MFSNRDLYYLKQMGIHPWIKKEKLDPILGEKSKLLIITDSDLSVKEHNLLAKIISFLALDKFSYKHLALKSKNPTELVLKNNIVLNFGSKFNSEFNAKSLSEIINHPKYKKELYNLLVTFKNKYSAL